MSVAFWSGLGHDVGDGVDALPTAESAKSSLDEAGSSGQESQNIGGGRFQGVECTFIADDEKPSIVTPRESSSRDPARSRFEDHGWTNKSHLQEYDSSYIIPENPEEEGCGRIDFAHEENYGNGNVLITDHSASNMVSVNPQGKQRPWHSGNAQSRTAHDPSESSIEQAATDGLFHSSSNGMIDPRALHDTVVRAKQGWLSNVCVDDALYDARRKEHLAMAGTSQSHANASGRMPSEKGTIPFKLEANVQTNPNSTAADRIMQSSSVAWRQQMLDASYVRQSLSTESAPKHLEKVDSELDSTHPFEFTGIMYSAQDFLDRQDNYVCDSPHMRFASDEEDCERESMNPVESSSDAVVPDLMNHYTEFTPGQIRDGSDPEIRLTSETNHSLHHEEPTDQSEIVARETHSACLPKSASQLEAQAAKLLWEMVMSSNIDGVRRALAQASDFLTSGGVLATDSGSQLESVHGKQNSFENQHDIQAQDDAISDNTGLSNDDADVKSLESQRGQNSLSSRSNASSTSSIQDFDSSGSIDQIADLDSEEQIRALEKFCHTRDRRRQNMLHVACIRCDIGMIRTLLSMVPQSIRESLLSANDIQSRTPVHLSCMGGSEEIIVACMSYLSPKLQSMLLTACDNNGDTPLHLAAQYGHLRVTVVLNRLYRCPLTLVNSHGYTAMHLAAIHGHPKIINELAKLDSSQVNRKTVNDECESALHLAVSRRPVVPAVVHALLANGANPGAMNAQGRTATDSAMECGAWLADDLMQGRRIWEGVPKEELDQEADRIVIDAMQKSKNGQTSTLDLANFSPQDEGTLAFQVMASKEVDDFSVDQESHQLRSPIELVTPDDTVTFDAENVGREIHARPFVPATSASPERTSRPDSRGQSPDQESQHDGKSVSLSLFAKDCDTISSRVGKSEIGSPIVSNKSANISPKSTTVLLSEHDIVPSSSHDDQISMTTPSAISFTSPADDDRSSLPVRRRVQEKIDASEMLTSASTIDGRISSSIRHDGSHEEPASMAMFVITNSDRPKVQDLSLDLQQITQDVAGKEQSASFVGHEMEFFGGDATFAAADGITSAATGSSLRDSGQVFADDSHARADHRTESTGFSVAGATSLSDTGEDARLVVADTVHHVMKSMLSSVAHDVQKVSLVLADHRRYLHSELEDAGNQQSASTLQPAPPQHSPRSNDLATDNTELYSSVLSCTSNVLQAVVSAVSKQFEVCPIGTADRTAVCTTKEDTIETIILGCSSTEQQAVSPLDEYSVAYSSVTSVILGIVQTVADVHSQGKTDSDLSLGSDDASPSSLASVCVPSISPEEDRPTLPSPAKDIEPGTEDFHSSTSHDQNSTEADLVTPRGIDCEKLVAESPEDLQSAHCSPALNEQKSHLSSPISPPSKDIHGELSNRVAKHRPEQMEQVNDKLDCTHEGTLIDNFKLVSSSPSSTESCKDDRGNSALQSKIVEAVESVLKSVVWQSSVQVESVLGSALSVGSIEQLFRDSIVSTDGEHSRSDVPWRDVGEAWSIASSKNKNDESDLYKPVPENQALDIQFPSKKLQSKAPNTRESQLPNSKPTKSSLPEIKAASSRSKMPLGTRSRLSLPSNNGKGKSVPNREMRDSAKSNFSSKQRKSKSSASYSGKLRTTVLSSRPAKNDVTGFESHVKNTVAENIVKTNSKPENGGLLFPMHSENNQGFDTDLPKAASALQSAEIPSADVPVEDTMLGKPTDDPQQTAGNSNLPSGDPMDLLRAVLSPSHSGRFKGRLPSPDRMIHERRTSLMQHTADLNQQPIGAQRSQPAVKRHPVLNATIATKAAWSKYDRPSSVAKQPDSVTGTQALANSTMHRRSTWATKRRLPLQRQSLGDSIRNTRNPDAKLQMWAAEPTMGLRRPVSAQGIVTNNSSVLGMHADSFVDKSTRQSFDGFPRRRPKSAQGDVPVRPNSRHSHKAPTANTFTVIL